MDGQRLSRKEMKQEIKQPDQFMVYSVQAIDWVKHNIQSLLYGVVGLIALVVILMLWFGWQRQHEHKARALLHEATKSLRLHGEGVAASPEQMLTQLQEITRDYGRTQAAGQAYWHLGQVYFEQGKYPEALGAYEQARRLAPNDSQRFTSGVVTLNIGYTQEATKAYEQAITSYEAVLQSSAHWLRGEAYLGMGRCYERLGTLDKAVLLYQRALADTTVPETARRGLEERLSLLQTTQAVPTQERATSHKS